MITIRKYGEITRYVTIKKVLTRSLFNANSYQVGKVIFDSGINTGDSLSSMVDGVDAVFVTHGHHDHIGNNHALQQRHGCKIYASENGLGRVGHPDNSSFIECLYAGAVEPSKVERCPESYDLDIKVEPIHTPGHSNDHMCYYIPGMRALFSGDLVLWGKTRWVSDEVMIWDAMDSLERVSKLKLERIYPGHGRPFEDAGDVINEKLSHLRQLGASVLEMHEAGMDHKSIRDKLLGKEEMMAFLTRGRFSKLNLIKSYIEGRPAKALP